MNIFDLRGPEFLVLYSVLFVVGIGVAFALRDRLRGPRTEVDIRTLNLQPVEVALLAEGEHHAVRAALAGLAQRELITVEGARTMKPTGRPAAGAPEIEQQVHAAIGSGQSFEQIAAQARSALRTARARLERLGLLIDASERWRVRIIPTLVLGAVLAIGAYKIEIGVDRGRPVGFLAALCCLTGLGMLFFWGRPPTRSRTGDDTLDTLRRNNMGLRQTVVAKPSRVAPEDFSLAVALYGAAIIQTGPLLTFRDALRPPPRDTSSSSSSSGSSCSSCSSSSCGGGCGGGGCGGCGS